MANQKKTYFLCQTWDYDPSGPVQLGSLITSPSRPADALNGPDAPHPSAASLFPPTTKTDVTWSTDKLRAGRYGLWSEFLSFLGLFVDFGLHNSAQAVQTLAFDTLETIEFAPTTEFLEATLAASPAATEFLARSRLRKALYVVTALKIARGARATTSRSKSHGVEVGAGVGGALLAGAPASLGPEVRTERSSGERSSFGGSSDFVFAFRLRKVAVERAGARVRGHGEYTSGAMYDADGPASARTAGLPFAVGGATSEDADASEFGGGSWTAVLDDDDEEAICVRPPDVPL